MNSIRHAIVLLVLTTLPLAVLGCAVFIGLGFLLTLWLPFTLFQSSCIAIGATICLALVVSAFTLILHFGALHSSDENVDEWDLIDDIDPKRFSLQNSTTPKTGRNAPCPCGSGKKFKHCCG